MESLQFQNNVTKEILPQAMDVVHPARQNRGILVQEPHLYAILFAEMGI